VHESETRAAIEAALLRECGERGYRKVKIADVLARSGSDRAEFDRSFASLEDCYAGAYAATTGALVARFEVASGRASGWRECLRETLRGLADFIESDPALAAGIVVAVGVVDGEATARRSELIARAVGALRAVRGDPEASEVPSRLAATLSVYTLEEAAATALGAGRPEQFRAALPDLTYLIVAACFDEETARAEALLASDGGRPD
jgi:AcrR family transcriptional regulator